MIEYVPYLFEIIPFQTQVVLRHEMKKKGALKPEV